VIRKALWLQLFFLTVFVPDYVRAQQLLLAETDSVRVWVFEDKTFKSVRLSVHTGTVLVVSGADTLVQLNENDRGIVLERYGNRVRLEKLGDDDVEQVRIIPIENSMMSVSTGSETKVFRGTLTIDTRGRQHSLRTINHVSLEDYVTSVIAGEMPFKESEALKTQAVIARTYALWNMALARRTEYDVTDHTASQVYIGEPVTKPWVRHAAEATAGEVLTWSGKLILSAYFSTSGGTTATNESVWKGKPLPYLRSIDDGDASRDSPHYRWEFSAPLKKLQSTFKSAFPHSAKTPLEIVQKDESGRVTHIRVGGHIMTGQEFRMQMISAFGPKGLKSTYFDIATNDESVIFSGRGMGHGVGLSQWGAYGLSVSGWSYVEILKFYYSGVEISNIHHVEGDSLELAL
jgi:stage II sporulation protein D